MLINPGELNKKIKFISFGTKRDSDGYIVPDRQVAYECWAKFNRTSGTEVLNSDADFSKIKARFLIRFSRNFTITNNMLIEYAGKDYEIKYVNNYGDSNEYVEIMAETLVSEHG